ncbi:HAD-IIB family hydrolase [Leuconostoc mesenteroides]|uniref:HAD-IIB family hydrolase n=1 Tax=Leuconostoc mesenteroides TaxID=1245 RepID=UPI002362A5A3|nr:HAD family hydrolase [Leuconostoc mesenteroides]
MTIQLIATDLDGTFLTDDKKFDQALFRNVLRELNKKHIQFTIATGVHQERINILFKDFLNEPLNFVTNNGARVVKSDGTVLFSKVLPPVTLRKIQQFLNNYSMRPDRGLVFSTDETAYLPLDLDMASNKRYFKYFKYVKSFGEVREINEPIYKVTMSWTNFDEKRFYDDALAFFGDDVHITETGTGAIDIVPAYVNKAEGLKMLAESYALDLSHAVAFGDGGNDLEMLNAVGLPYKMPDADIIGQFNVALSDNNHSGVLKTIQQLITTK